MNKQETHEAILVMKAYCDGAEIEERFRLDRSHDDVGWRITTNPEWDLEDCNYRIKPKAREFWIAYHGAGNATAHSSHKLAEEWSLDKTEIIKVREVL